MRKAASFAPRRDRLGRAVPTEPSDLAAERLEQGRRVARKRADTREGQGARVACTARERRRRKRRRTARLAPTRGGGSGASASVRLWTWAAAAAAAVAELRELGEEEAGLAPSLARGVGVRVDVAAEEAARLESPPPPPSPPPPLLKLVEEGDALLKSSDAVSLSFAHALSLALGADGVQAAAPPPCAAAGDAAADCWPSVPPMASKRTKHT